MRRRRTIFIVPIETLDLTLISSHPIHIVNTLFETWRYEKEEDGCRLSAGDVNDDIRGFVSHRETHIELDPNGAPIPGTGDALFMDGFETGDLSAWSQNVNDSGDLAASAGAAMAGDYGMIALIDDNNRIYIVEESPFMETRYRARFYFDPNTITMANNNAHYIFYGYGASETLIVRIELRYSVGDYQIRAEARDDGSTWSSSDWVTLPDGPHAIELDWQAASGDGSNNGRLSLWVDEEEKAAFTNIGNDTRRMEKV